MKVSSTVRKRLATMCIALFLALAGSLLLAAPANAGWEARPNYQEACNQQRPGSNGVWTGGPFVYCGVHTVGIPWAYSWTYLGTADMYRYCWDKYRAKAKFNYGWNPGWFCYR